jgi:7-cyano-7-deazaguanine synthase in queuosine biosynthesis
MPVYLLSGGLDSVVLMHWCVRYPYMFGFDPGEEGSYRHVAMHFRTGIRVDDRLSEICRYHCQQLRVELVEMDLGHLWIPGSRARGEAPESAESPIELAQRSANDPFWTGSFDYQDGRGLLFLTFCGMEASKRGIPSVMVAFQHEEDEIPSDEKDPMVSDAGADFLQAFCDVSDSGGFLPKRAPGYYAPFEENSMSKRHIVQLGWHLGVDLDETLSCEFSDPPCGNCMGCTRRKRAFDQARTMEQTLQEAAAIS